MNETQKQVRSVTQASEPLIQVPSHARLVCGCAIGETGFDIPMTVFFRVKFRGVLGQWFYDDLWVIPKIADRLFTGMDRGLVTDQDETFWHEAMDMLQGEDHVLTLHATIKMTFVNLARQGQANRCAQDPSVARDSRNHRTLTTRTPGGPQLLLKRVAKLIKKHDVYAAPPRFFQSWANPAPAKHGSTLPPVLERAPGAVASSNSA